MPFRIYPSFRGRVQGLATYPLQRLAIKTYPIQLQQLPSLSYWANPTEAYPYSYKGPRDMPLTKPPLAISKSPIATRNSPIRPLQPLQLQLLQLLQPPFPSYQAKLEKRDIVALPTAKKQEVKELDSLSLGSLETYASIKTTPLLASRSLPQQKAKLQARLLQLLQPLQLQLLQLLQLPFPSYQAKLEKRDIVALPTAKKQEVKELDSLSLGSLETYASIKTTPLLASRSLPQQKAKLQARPLQLLQPLQLQLLQLLQPLQQQVLQPLQPLQQPPPSYQAKPTKASSLSYRGYRDMPFIKPPFAISKSSIAKGVCPIRLL
jgi:hypothetical protein